MRTLCLLLFSLMLWSATALAEPIAPTTVRIVYGEKHSQFEIDPAQLTFVSSSHPLRVHPLTPVNYQYLRKVIGEIKGPFSKPADCPRRRATIIFEGQEMHGCLAGKTTADKKIRDLIELLSLAI